jgi:hypothetical protein
MLCIDRCSVRVHTDGLLSLLTVEKCRRYDHSAKKRTGQPELVSPLVVGSVATKLCHSVKILAFSCFIKNKTLITLVLVARSHACRIAVA